jgi:photosystem II stability/assembly factor-like uncharacterized protein
MSRKWLTIFCVTLGFTLSGRLFAQQETESARWNMINPASTELSPQINPYPQSLLESVKNYVHPITSSRIIYGAKETYLVPGNFRVHPSTVTTQSEVPITRHPTNDNIMFASSNAYRPSGGFISEGVYVTTDGGTTWFGSDTLNSTPITGHSGDPGPVIDKDGRFYMTHLGGSTGMAANYSTDNGITWSTSFSIPGGSSSDKNLSGADDVPSSPYYGRVYNVWTNFAGTFTNRIVISYTTNGGVSWTPATVVSPPTSTGHHHQGCDVRVGPTGQVYVVWANCTTNGQNSTEDSLGFARSTDGGVTWAYATNSADDMNGIRAASYLNSIRVSGFPRIDVDRSGGPRNGWIYVVAGEKNVAPATDIGDIVLHRSTDGGTTWSKVRVNQDAPGSGKYQYMGAVSVDASGGVNVVYYDTRNIATNDSAEVYVSRSLDGGNTWTDILASDHRFKPKPISGLATGYQGDYIGITSAGGKTWPYWCDDITGLYQAWTVGITTTENFGWVKGTVTNVSGGAALSGVTVDFTNPIPQAPGTSDPTGFYKAGAKVDTPGTTRNVTLRGRKFGFRDTLINVTITRNDTLTRNFAMTPVPNGTLVVRTVRKDSTNIRSAITVLFAGSPVASGNTDSLTGLYSTVLPLGTYDVLVDPPSPYGNRRFNGVTIATGSNPLYVVVRAVIENSPATMRDTLSVGGLHTKTLQLTNTTATDTVSYRLSDDNALARARFSKSAVQPSEVPIFLPERPKGAPDTEFGDSPTGSGGPDAFGYRWVDSDSIGGGVTYSWVEINSVGTPVTTWSGSTDDGSFSTTLPWSFPYYGNGYTNFFFTTNGWIGFNTPSTQYSNVAIPNVAEPNNAIYAWWDDLDAVGISGDRTVYYYNDIANSQYIVEWNNVRHLSATTDTLKFQIILKPNGEILFQYNRMISPTNLTTATIGIENAAGSTGLQVVYNAAYIHNSLAIKFYLPDAPWISESPSFGRINPGATQNITVTFDAAGLIAGTTYNGKIIMDVTHPDVTGSALIPASLSVTSTGNTVSVTSPNGGEIWNVGSTYPITWAKTGAVDSVRIEYSTSGSGGPWNLISAGVPARVGIEKHPKFSARPIAGGEWDNPNGTFNWLVPNAPSTNCFVRVSWKSNLAVTDVSNAAFTISVPIVQDTIWVAQTSGSTQDIYAIKTIDINTAWVGTGTTASTTGTILRTTNGGTTWANVGSFNAGVYAITAIDANTAIAASYNATATRLHKTTNGGATWTTVDSVAGGFYDCVHMFDATNGYAQGDPTPAGTNWVLKRTTNGGTTWVSAATLAGPGTEAGWNNAMMWLDQNNGWFGTNNTKVYRTTNGGTTWTGTASPSLASTYGVHFNALNNGLTGGVATLLKSTDAGATWAAGPASVGGQVFGIWGPAGSQEFWVANGSNVSYSSNSGTSWTTTGKNAYTSSGSVYHLHMVKSGANIYGWAGGLGGTIVRYRRILTGVEAGQPEIPAEFALSQNYPNPFNPTTRIKYDLPEQATVVLKIYNVLGQEVATLANAPQAAGYYETTWDGRNNFGANVGSGVYFYRFEATSASGQTFANLKKMVFLK